MEKQIQKKPRMVSMPINEYRRLKRREDQLLKAKNHIRIAWQAISRVDENKE